MIQNILYQRSLRVNDYIDVLIPTVGEVVDHEEEYYGLVSLFTASPIDLCVQLDDIGVDFTTINDWELFLILFGTIQQADTSLVFRDLDLSGFQPAINTENNTMVLQDVKTGRRIDRALHWQIAAAVRKIHHLERDNRKMGNEEARRYYIERARVKMRRKKNRKVDSQLEDQIIALVNTEQFKYDFDTVRDLTIYQFNESLRQVIKKIEYSNRMHGVYSGTVDVKSMSQDELNWLVRSKI